MAERPSSFEERLARIADTRETPDGSVSATPPPPARRREHGNGGIPKGAMIFAVLFLLAAAGAFLTMLSSDRVFVQLASWASERELADDATPRSTLFNSDTAGDAAVGHAVTLAERRLKSGELSAVEERSHRAFIDDRAGKTMADVSREHMIPMIRLEARNAGQTQLGEKAVADLEACKTTNCLAYVEFKFRDTLRKHASN